MSDNLNTIKEVVNKKFLGTDQIHNLVMDNIPAYVFWKDRESVYLGCNLNFAIAAGLTKPEEIIGKTDYDLSWTRQESDSYRTVDKKVMDSGISELDFEESQTTPSGQTKWLKTTKIPLFNSHKEVIGILGTYEEITKRKEIELELIRNAEILKKTNENLKDSNFNLEQANIDLEHFSYATYHDLQEPLKVIEGFTNLIKSKYIDQFDKDGQEYLNFITEGVNRMSKLTKGMLSYSKLDTDKGIFELADFNKIVNQVILDLKPRIEESGANITYNLPNEQIKCQSNRIGLLFSNLITNGLKFNKSNNPLITINFEEQENHWLFTLSDNGIGIEENYKDLIFRPFKRLNTRSDFPGSGIGLSICKRIVNLHQGEIWFNSSEQDGTVFHFTIKKSIVNK